MYISEIKCVVFLKLTKECQRVKTNLSDINFAQDHISVKLSTLMTFLMKKLASEMKMAN